VHGVQRPGEERAFGYEERGLACGAAAEGEDAVGVGFARVAGDDGVESVGEGLVGRGEGEGRGWGKEEGKVGRGRGWEEIEQGKWMEKREGGRGWESG